MTRDRDEWRRAWPEGTLPGPEPRVETRVEPGPLTVTPEAWWVEPTDAAGATTSVRPPDASGTVVAPARPPGRGFVPGIVGGALGAVVGTVATLALVAGGVMGGVVAQRPGTAGVGAASVTAPIITTDGVESVVPAVAAAVTPSVVRIDVVGPVASGRGSVGSGVIYRSDGYIITNFHVVEGARAITVRLADGELLDAELIGTDPHNDLAVLRVTGWDLAAFNLRDRTEPLRVGETVVAIGSPFGLDASVTAGIVSALNREIRVDEVDGVVNTIPSAIQTDAAINPGNSGGALVDTRGRLVGINTAIYTNSGANEGIGFAVSAEQAVSSADQLILQGFVRHPLLGITGIDVSREIAERMDLATTRGAMVDSVSPGSGAAAAGLRPGDIIVAVDGSPLATMSELVAEVRRRRPGDEVRLTVFRDGTTFEVAVTLGERPRG